MVNDVNVPYISLILWELFITYLGKTNSLTQILRPLSFLLIPEPALESILYVLQNLSGGLYRKKAGVKQNLIYILTIPL